MFLVPYEKTDGTVRARWVEAPNVDAARKTVRAMKAELGIAFVITHPIGIMVRQIDNAPHGMLTPTVKLLALAVHTANEWSSDQKGKGLAFLSLGTTRKIHTQDHKDQLRVELDANMRYCRECRDDRDNMRPEFDPVLELDRLRDLACIVESKEIGEEWLPYADYFAITEEMHTAGTL